MRRLVADILIRVQISVCFCEFPLEGVGCSMLCFLPFTILHCFSWLFSSSHRVVWTILLTVKKFQLISLGSGFGLISYVLCFRD